LRGVANARKWHEGPVRILHALYGMNRGGAETWLMHVLRHIDRDRFRMDFLVHTTQPGGYDDEIRALGSKVIPCPHRPAPWAYAARFKRILRQHGPYDIVHAHSAHFSGYMLRLAHQAGVPVRMAHSHNDTAIPDRNARTRSRLCLRVMNWWIRRHATVGLAASGKAAAALFGPDWQADPRWRILHYGIDPAPFGEAVSSVEVRAELGIPANAFVIGHVGRFDEQKNHAFLVDIFAEVARQEPQARLLLVGGGALRPSIEEKAERLRMADRVVFAGVREDVPRLMRGAMDVFVFPSLYEGLPIAGIEAQAAGLPFVLSDVITEEMDVVTPLLRRVSLSQPARAWAEAVRAARLGGPQISHAEALLAVESSSLNISTSVANLEALYDE